MDITTAYAVVGVERGTSISDAKTAFRSRSKLLHPDRADGSSLPEAERAMAQLTEAWAAVQRDIHGTGEAIAAHELYRPPAEGECAFCGWAPAAPILLRRTVGLVILWRWHVAMYDACRVCARALYAEHQARSLLLGWWGIVAPVANLVNMFRNRLALATHRRNVSRPSSHDERVVSLADGPLRYRSPWIRPSSLLATGVAFLVIAAAGSSWAHRVSPTTTSPSVPAVPAYVAPVVTGVGGCLDASGVAVACGDSSSRWTLTEMVSTPDTCAADGFDTAFTSSSGEVYCADQLQ
jgi:hypothetical protein